MADDRARLSDRPVLVAVAVGLAVVELGIVSLLGPHTALASSPQVSAPAPYDVFHDLRWLAVYVPSWLTFVVAVAGSCWGVAVGVAEVESAGAGSAGLACCSGRAPVSVPVSD